MNEHLHHLAQIAQTLNLPPRMKKPATIKALIARQLAREGWYVRPRFMVASRGDNGHYRGAIDLVCWPPPIPDPRYPPTHAKHLNTHISHRPPPVLVNLDNKSIRHKTRAKLASFEYPHSGTMVILTHADNTDTCQGIDIIVCLGQ